MTKDEIADDIITILNGIRKTNEEDGMTFTYNFAIDDMVKHIQYYKEGKYDEWLKDLKTQLQTRLLL